MLVEAVVAWSWSLRVSEQRGWTGISVTAEEHLSVTDGSPPAKPQMDLGSSGPHQNFLLPSRH